MLGLLDILGQDTAVARLQRGLTGRRRPHAYLFAGPAGVGRRTTAEALAAALLCSRPTSQPNEAKLPDLPGDHALLAACGACDDCRMMAAGSHPDYHPIYKELAAFHPDPKVRDRVMQDLGIDVIRHFLIAPVGQTPARGRGKVFVVRQAELMSVPAQNALLKTLEEPPDGVAILLLCRNAQALLPTTLSRCSLVRFGPLPEQFVRQALTGRGAGEAEAAFWARFADGSIGRATALAGGELYKIKCDMVARLAAMPAGGDEDLAEELSKTTDKLAAAAVTAARSDDGASLSKNLAARQTTGTMLQLLACLYVDALTIAVGADRRLVHADQADAAAAVAERFTPTKLAEIIEQLSEFERMLWQNVNPRIVWDNVVVTCASAAPLRV